MTTPLAARIAREYGTPAAVIDMERVERNITRIQAACDAAGVANRPHIKTHKSPMLAKLQIEAGARGITCQKLGEAEVMVEGGLDDILISYNLIGAEKMGRLGRLLKRATITVAADNPTVIEGLPHAAEIAGRSLGVVIECDTGRKRRASRRRKRRSSWQSSSRRAPACASKASCSIPPSSRGRRRSASTTRP